MGQFNEELLVYSNRIYNKFENYMLLKRRITKYFFIYYNILFKKKLKIIVHI